MEWKNYADQIRELLGLKGNPVAITFSMKPPSTSVDGKYRVCNAFLHARDGKVIDLTVSTSACAGGTRYMGLGEGPRGEGDKALKEFLVDGGSSTAL